MMGFAQVVYLASMSMLTAGEPMKQLVCAVTLLCLLQCQSNSMARQGKAGRKKAASSEGKAYTVAATRAAALP